MRTSSPTPPGTANRLTAPRHGVVPMLLACAALALAGGRVASAQQPGFDAIVAAADAARSGNEIPRAIELYRQAVQLDSQYADGWWFLGFLQYGSDDYPAARDALTHFIDLKPPAGPALALRGLCEFQTAEYPQALTDIEQGLALGAANQPRNEQLLRLHEALLLTRAAKFERAIQTYLLLANEGFASPAGTVGLGLAGLRLAVLPQEVPAPQQDLAFAAGQAALQLTAARAARAAVAAPPAGNQETSAPAAATRITPNTSTDTRGLSGTAGSGAGPAVETGDGAAADPGAGFAALAEHYPTVPNVHYFYGYLLFASAPERSEAQFKKELTVNPQSAPAQAMLAWAALMRSDPAAAVQPGTAAVAADPSLPLAQLVLGRALLETGSTAAGTEHLEQARQLEPDNLETHLALARAYSTANHPEEARRERLLCLRLTEDHAPAP